MIKLIFDKQKQILRNNEMKELEEFPMHYKEENYVTNNAYDEDVNLFCNTAFIMWSI